MPDVRGLNEADARQVLADAGYSPTVVEIDEIPSVLAAGTVAAQSPVAGTTKPESIILSLPSPAKMPDLTGETLEEATRILAAMGAQPVVERTYDGSADAGTILKTDPATGAVLIPTPMLIVASAPASESLSSLEGDGDCNAVASASVNGTTITDGVSCRVGEEMSKTFWLLGRDLAGLKAIVGIEDGADPGSRAKVKISADEAVLLDQELAYGQSVELDADITGALRLEVEVSRTADTAGNLSRYSVLLGDAVVVGSAEAIAGLEVTP
ncbi:PASTA domain-containing protein [Arthrobacter sp. D2-10]